MSAPQKPRRERLERTGATDSQVSLSPAEMSLDAALERSLRERDFEIFREMRAQIAIRSAIARANGLPNPYQAPAHIEERPEIIPPPRDWLWPLLAFHAACIVGLVALASWVAAR
jgi:hypothetical protein